MKIISGLRWVIGFVVYTLLGYFICKFPLLKNYKNRLLSTWMFPEKRGRVDNLLYGCLLPAWFRFEYLAEKNPDKRESLKEMLMGGEGGRKWASIYDSRQLDFEEMVGNMPGKEACPLLPTLDKMLSNTIEPSIVVQLGSSSGREIAWLAQRHQGYIYIGTDIYPEVIAYSSEHHVLPNLTFEKCSAKEISDLLRRYKNRRIIVFSSGSLQYVQPEHLMIFFESLSRFQVEVFLLEPGDESKGNPAELEGSLWRGNFSYTHNYRYYAEKAGLTTLRCEIIRPDRSNTIHYFYHGNK